MKEDMLAVAGDLTRTLARLSFGPNIKCNYT